MTEQFIIRVTDNSSDSEESDDDDSEMSGDNEVRLRSCFYPESSTSTSKDELMEGISLLGDV